MNVESPLLPGYVLCRFDVNHRLPVLCTAGVQRIIGVGNMPVAIDEEELKHFRSVADSNMNAAPHAYQPGQTVRIDAGPFAGVEGCLVSVKNQTRLVVAITLLHRAVAVEIEEGWIALGDQRRLA